MDAQDILGLEPKPSSLPLPLQKSQQKKERTNSSPFNLGSRESPSNRVTTLLPSYPPVKRKKVTRRAVPWVWRYFQNSARNDNIRLSHWVKVADDPSRDYPFAKFDKKINLVEYTDEEYDKYLQDEHWTKIETDHLFDLCRQFDLRFPVIADRFEGNKTLEEMKERYYSVSRLMLAREERNSFVSSENPKREEVKVAGISESSERNLDWKQQLELFGYDKDRDVRRKKQLEAMISRNSEQAREEEILMQDFKRIESFHKSSSSARNRVLKTAQDALTFRSFIVKSKPSTPKVTKKRKRDDGKSDRQNKGGNFLRSTRMLGGSSAKMMARVNSALQELQVPENPQTTARVSKVFGELKSEVAILLDLHDQLAKAEHEAELLRQLVQNSPSFAPMQVESPAAPTPESKSEV